MPAGPPVSGVPTHHSTALQPGDRGREFGAAQRDAIANTVDFYRRLLQRDVGAGEDDLRRWGGHAGEAIAALNDGRFADELCGMATGSGQPLELLMAINARTELLAGTRYAAGPGGARAGGRLTGAPECSAVGMSRERTRARRCLLGQNWDFHPDLRRSRVLWGLQRSGGRWCCTLTEAGILGKIGMNSSGLASAINFLVTADDGGVAGTPVHVLARAVLECEDLTGALRELLTRPVSASTAFNLAFSDADADSLLTVEVTPSGARVVAAPERGVLVHTNHFLESAGISDLVLGPCGWFGTIVRHRELTSALAGLGEVEPDDLFARLASHHNAPESICLHKDGDDREWIDRGATLASLVMDVSGRRLWLAGGQPCRTSPEVLDAGGWLAGRGARGD